MSNLKVIPLTPCVNLAEERPITTETEPMSSCELSALLPAWSRLPRDFQRQLLSLAQTVQALSAMPRQRRRSPVRALAPDERVDPDTALRAQAFFRRFAEVSS
ncbi:MAG: hypothetical protein R3A48_04045 [Polyangiales bacterium]